MKPVKKTLRNLQASLLIAIAFVLASNASLSAAQFGSKKFGIGFSVLTPDYVPVWIAKEEGFFKGQSLDGEVVFIRGATLGVQALVSGDLRILVASGAAAVDSNLQGVDTVIVATLANRFPFTLFSAPDIKSVAQLKGKTIAINSLTGAAVFATKLIVKKFGLNPDKDVTYIASGSGNARLALLKGGVIAATILTSPQTLAARQAGFNMLYDLSDADIPYQSAGVATLRSILKEDRAAVTSAVKAIIQATHFLKTRKNESIKVISKFLRVSDPELLEEAYDSAKRRLLTKPVIDPEGIKTVQANSGVPNATKAPASRFFDGSIVRELEESGFIDRLYAAAPAR